MWRERFVAYAPLFLWIGVIFYLSSGEGSMSQTSLIIRPILEFLFPNASEQTLLVYHYYIRKFAHFAEYAVLGFLAVRAFAGSSSRALRNYKYLVGAALVLAVAGSDEFNQSLEPTRTSSIWDVAIDTFGGVTAILLMKALKR